MLVPLLGALAALVVAAGAFVVLRNKSEEVDSPHATYRDALVKPKALPAAATKPSSARTDQAKIDAEARALGLGAGHPRAVEPQAGVVADDSSSGPTAEQLAAQGAKHGPSAPTATQLQQELRQLKRSVGISGHPRVTWTGRSATARSMTGTRTEAVRSSWRAATAGSRSSSRRATATRRCSRRASPTSSASSR